MSIDGETNARLDITSAWMKQCLVNPAIEFLNAGTLAPTLKCAFDATQASMLAWVTQGPGGSLNLREARGYLAMMEEQDRCKRVVADWLNVPTSSLALLGNATDGVNAALSSMSWKSGDRIITTDEEHEALRHPLVQLQARFDVHVDEVSFPKSAEDVSEFYERIGSAVRRETRLVALSSVSHKTGIHIDTTKLASALSGYDDVWLLIDGSHEAGTSLQRVHPRMDFYTFPGHKWLFGPIETGVLWVSDRALAETTPLLAGSPMSTAEGVRHTDLAGAWRFEYGTRDWTKMVGLAEAVHFRQQWPEQALVEQYGALHQSFSAAFEAASGIRLHGQSPVVSFETDHSTDIANHLWEKHRVLVKPQDGNIRVSLPLWLSTERVRDLGGLIGQSVAALRR